MDPLILRELVMKHEQMVALFNDIKDTVRMECTNLQYEQAKAYWLGHIGASLGGTDYVDDMFTMLKLLKELGYDEDTDSVPGDDGREDEMDDAFEECDEHVAIRVHNLTEDKAV